MGNLYTRGSLPFFSGNFSLIGVLWCTGQLWQHSACCWFHPPAPCSLSRGISILPSLHLMYGSSREERRPLVWTQSKCVGVIRTEAAHWNCASAAFLLLHVFGPHQMPPWTKITLKWVSSLLHPSGPLPWWLQCTASTPNSTPSSSTCTGSWTTTRVNVLISVILLMVCSLRSPWGLSYGHDCVQKYSDLACLHYSVSPQQKTCQLNKSDGH